MSDGLSDAAREAEVGAAIQEAAQKLAEALEEANDAAFGLPEGALEIVNEELHYYNLGVALVFAGRRARRI